MRALTDTGAPCYHVVDAGEEPILIDESTLQPTDGGYLVARTSACTEELMQGQQREQGQEEEEEQSPLQQPVRVVSVVGLAHANGVLGRCEKAGLRFGLGGF